MLKYVKTHKIQKVAADIGIDNIEGNKKDVIQPCLKDSLLNNYWYAYFESIIR